jgi:hypothetical protein
VGSPRQKQQKWKKANIFNVSLIQTSQLQPKYQPIGNNMRYGELCISCKFSDSSCHLSPFKKKNKQTNNQVHHISQHTSKTLVFLYRQKLKEDAYDRFTVHVVKYSVLPNQSARYKH